VLLYLIGTSLRGRSVGVMAAAIMMSSLWFMLRARSGNLDVPFLFWSLFTFYWLTRARHHVRYFYPAVIGFVAMFLTKTLVGVSMLPVFIYVWWLQRAALSKRQLLNLGLLTLVLILPWYAYNQASNPDFLTHHFIAIGFKSKSNAFSGAALTQALYYLRVGVGRWFKLMMLALPISLLIWYRQKSLRFSLQLVGLYALGLVPFLFSRSVEVWHLVPIYAPLALLTAMALTEITTIIPKYRTITAGLVTAGVLLLATYQFRQSANLIYAASPQSSSERDISRQAAQYPVVYLVETFYPAAVYYSGTHIVAMGTEPQAYQIVTAMLRAGQGPFIVHQSLVDQLTADKTPFRVLSQSVKYYLITY
jgi:4-amino-4-deoxy-L-arabinose transferase-like glycosyltransferase